MTGSESVCPGFIEELWWSDYALLLKIALLTLRTALRVVCVRVRVCAGLFRKLRSGGLARFSGAAALHVYIRETMKRSGGLCRPTFSAALSCISSQANRNLGFTQ